MDLAVEFFVTARHLIDKIRTAQDGNGKILLRLNSTGGEAVWLETPHEHWIFPTDELVDAAILLCPPDADYALSFVPTTSFATEGIIESQGIGIGTEVFIAGLFSEHPGRTKNIPIVRAGTIAAMPEERVAVDWARGGRIDAYLIECRSIRGLSGSPVFAYIGPSAFGREGGIVIRSGLPSFYLLGLVHGHWDWPDADIEQDVLFPNDEKLNIGIAIVVPAEKIKSMMELPKALEHITAVEGESRASLRLPKPD